MYRFLVAALFCAVAHATPTLPPHAPTPRASQVSAQPEMIKTAAAGSGLRAEAARDKRAPAGVASGDQESSSEPGTREMVLAALALMLGIAIRRHGVGRK